MVRPLGPFGDLRGYMGIAEGDWAFLEGFALHFRGSFF